MSTEARFQVSANRSDLLAPLLTVVCCCVPIAAFAPNLSTRKRVGLLTAWVMLLAIGWLLSGVQPAST